VVLDVEGEGDFIANVCVDDFGVVTKDGLAL